MGASFGTAIFGALLTARLTHYLLLNLPAAQRAKVNPATLTQSTGTLTRLPPSVVHDILTAFTSAFHDVFLLTVPFAALTFGVSLLLRETPLRSSTREVAEGQAFDGH